MFSSLNYLLIQMIRMVMIGMIKIITTNYLLFSFFSFFFLINLKQKTVVIILVILRWFAYHFCFLFKSRCFFQIQSTNQNIFFFLKYKLKLIEHLIKFHHFSLTTWTIWSTIWTSFPFFHSLLFISFSLFFFNSSF